MLLSSLQISRRKLLIIAVLILSATASVTYAVTTQESPKDDPILRAMQAELDREQAQLLLPGMQRPYFIEYRLDDFSTYEAVANYGALVREEAGHQRIVRVTVRIGSYATDSSSSPGEGSLAVAAIDNNPHPICYSLSADADEAYKNALRASSTKQAALKRFETPPTEKDFAPAKPIVSI